MGGGGSPSPSPEKGDVSGTPAPWGLVLSTPLSPGLLTLTLTPSPVRVGTGRPRGLGRSLGPQPEAGDLGKAVTAPRSARGPGWGCGEAGGRTTRQRRLGGGCRSQL